MSDELLLTLRRCPNVQGVHFTANGEHFFEVYQHSLGLFGRVLAGVPDLRTRIVKSLTREQVLSGGEPSKEAETALRTQDEVIQEKKKNRK